MKKADVRIGSEYFANVTNKRVVVRINAENASGGWDATNLTTNKKVRIKTAQRLLGSARSDQPIDPKEPRAETRVPKKANKANAVDAEPVAAEPVEKKLSCVTAALKVLEESNKPMNTQEMITAMADAGY